MVPQKISIVTKVRIFAHLFADFAVVVQKAVKTSHVRAVSVAIVMTGIAVGITVVGPIAAISISILPIRVTVAEIPIMVVRILESHKCVRLLGDLLLYAGVILQIRIELRMPLQVLRIVDQRGRSAKLIRNVAMPV
ncbi:MAG TPA: hypothetical protein VGG45_04220 [Terracidiphilus sp.]|jgi:hypothetical protein